MSGLSNRLTEFGFVFAQSIYSDIALARDRLLTKLAFWNIAIVLKILPCVLLTILSVALLRILMKAGHRRLRLKSNAFLETSSQVGDAQTPDVQVRKRSIAPHPSRETDRTTKMLLAILMLYVISELPYGIAILLMGILGSEFQSNVFAPLWEVFDILILFNAGANFLLLVSMSRMFRETFCQIFCFQKRHPTDSKKSSLTPVT